MVQPLWKTVGQFLKKLNIELLYDPAIPVLHIHPKELKTGTQTDTYTPMFITALFKIAKRWKKHQCSSMGEWINKMWSIQTTEYYSAIKRKEVLSHAEIPMHFENIMLREISQTQRFNLHEGSMKSNS